MSSAPSIPSQERDADELHETFSQFHSRNYYRRRRLRRAITFALTIGFSVLLGLALVWAENDPQFQAVLPFRVLP